MAWLFGGRKQSGTGQSYQDAPALKASHLSNLQDRVPGLQRKANDNSLFEVQVHAPPDGRSVVLRVFLPTRFPEERPVLQLLSQVQHPWVNQYMQVVGHPDLNGWDGRSNKLLGDIINEIISEFQRGCQGLPNGSPYQHPSQGPLPASGSQYPGQQYRQTYIPQTSSIQSPAQSPGGYPASRPGAAAASEPGDSSRRIGAVGAEQAKETKHHTPMPPIPTSFKELSDMSLVQLRRMLDDDVARQAHLDQLDTVKGMREVRDGLRKGNAQTAGANLGHEVELEGLREEAQDLQMTLRNLHQEYQGQARELSELAGPAADQAILKRVKEASKHADQSSEKTAAQLLDGKLTLPEFMDSYLKQRIRYHMLAAKIECMKRQINF